MKKGKVLLIMILAITSIAISGCSKNKNESGASSSPASSQSATSSVAVSSAIQSEAQSAAPSSNPTSVAGNEPTQSQPGQVIVIQTDDKAFDKLFKANPIDKAYIKDSNKAFSSVEMIQLSQKYADIWSKEVTHAYAELTNHMQPDSSLKPAALRAEQEKWVSGKAAALQKITTDAQAAGGTMAEVDAASGVMDYYRTRAAQVYKSLYAYDKNYSYAFK